MVHAVSSKQKSEQFRLPERTAARLKRLAFQASLDEGRRVTFGKIVERALDALERELGKASAAGKRKK